MRCSIQEEEKGKRNEEERKMGKEWEGRGGEGE